MNEYETEEQQVAALKSWWKSNGTSIIVGLFVGVASIFGYREYVNQNHGHLVQASDLYMQAAQSVALQTIDKEMIDDKAVDINNTLINEYGDTPYAALSSLALAKLEYEKNNIDAAVAQLELAVKHASDDMIKQIANLRLARVYIEQEKYTEATTILEMAHDAAYDAQIEELKGDIYRAKGEVEAARSAYDKAISLQGASASKWLRLKRQNLGA
ncbi:MAG: hypothetical protein COA54_05100 [Thiotrichaceae bacterium]|nr:MAG: hypothetical protein COA54_05100 [Thiotrichaceae bacterium]